MCTHIKKLNMSKYNPDDGYSGNEYDDLGSEDEYGENLDNVLTQEVYPGYWIAFRDGHWSEGTEDHMHGIGDNKDEAIQDLLYREADERAEEMERRAKRKSRVNENKNINIISKLITEARSSSQKTKRLYVDDLQSKLLGDYSYDVEFTVAYSVNPGDPGVWRDSNNEGYPATSPTIDWEVYSIDQIEVYDSLGNPAKISMTPELEDKIKQAIATIDDDKIWSMLDLDSSDEY